MSKWSFAFYILLRFIGQAVVLTLFFAGLTSLMFYLNEQQLMNMVDLFQAVVANPIYQVLFFIMIFVHGRTVLIRMDDKEVQQ